MKSDFLFFDLEPDKEWSNIQGVGNHKNITEMSVMVRITYTA